MAEEKQKYIVSDETKKLLVELQSKFIQLDVEKTCFDPSQCPADKTIKQWRAETEKESKKGAEELVNKLSKIMGNQARGASSLNEIEKFTASMSPKTVKILSQENLNKEQREEVESFSNDVQGKINYFVNVRLMKEALDQKGTLSAKETETLLGFRATITGYLKDNQAMDENSLKEYDTRLEYRILMKEDSNARSEEHWKRIKELEKQYPELKNQRNTDDFQKADARPTTDIGMETFASLLQSLKSVPSDIVGSPYSLPKVATTKSKIMAGPSGTAA